MKKQIWHTTSGEETRLLARRIASHVQEGDVFALEGGLGAGKTTFCQGLAKGLEIERYVDSPTFTVIKEYQGRLPLYHMDVYRLDGVESDLGLEEYFYGDGVCVIEWASIIQEILPDDTITFSFEVQEDGTRSISFPINSERAKCLAKDVLWD
ncbi:tRNA (adenosine(37)-N6)-threonylcarbamoyltransferase complex ATPase subunit type 1 TsaE [Thermoactinomyces sp. DSM 45892]|uniref:tRNA (adenosine(37)-N6)-threonylcarbamoyltransferase complex ATPase subunit type 1 TsaE n=1 Tax=Thermoactinomyces sp. DSM 45892 TaxID=1882753 RepID=UPI00089DA194|nr:tRNA (adenosine(37)-N6)-threonylcarbamoyltransferase complex ATPase subunit type 1 TsaE [Thermoactinomyces sp. DSM 45892]SDZ30994.1 tRNA threonylcarbamoyladenosine biosynthesis protein TsaE [Thermoactinomyces sp. DSM 45892]